VKGLFTGCPPHVHHEHSDNALVTSAFSSPQHRIIILDRLDDGALQWDDNLRFNISECFDGRMDRYSSAGW
jgi:hypothetical protein